MAKPRPFFSNFTRGEVSAYISGRPDIGPFFNSAKRLENKIVLPEGGVTNRIGTIVVAEVKDSSRETILLHWVRSQNLSYVIEAGHQYMRFYRNGEPIRISGGGELVVNGTFNTGIASWADLSIAPGSFSWRSSQQCAQLDNGVTGEGVAVQTITTLAGATYQLRFDVVSGPELFFSVGAVPALDDIIAATPITAIGSYLYTFVAMSTSTNIHFRRLPDTISKKARFDNVSLTQVLTPYEISTPYVEQHLNEIQKQQSVDVLFLDHGRYEPRKLSNFADTDWRLSLLNPDPAPSFEDDTDISGGTAQIVFAAASGTGVVFTCSAAKFLPGDVGRQIVSPSVAGLAVIRTIDGGNASGTVDILEPWAALTLLALNWKLRLSPQTTFDPDLKAPIGVLTTCVAGVATWRPEDQGKYIKVYGGELQIVTISSDTNITCKILSVLNQSTTADPAAAPAGAWRLEVPSWSVARGYPKTLEFHQGRLDHAATNSQPTTVWGSASDGFDNYAVGSLAADAYEFTVRSGKANAITWLASVNELMMGEENTAAPIQPLHIGTGIRFAKGPGVDAPIGGDVIPFITTVKGQLFYVNSHRTEIRQLRYQLEQDGVVSTNLNILGRHLFDPKEGGSRIKQAALAYAEKPNSVIYILREDGQLIALTVYDQEQVLAFTHLITDGEFESVAVVPNGQTDQVWVVVKRDINGQVKRYVEYFADDAVPNSSRTWTELYTDCAKVITLPFGQTTSALTGLGHLEGKTVHVIYSPNEIIFGGGGPAPKSGRYVGQFLVAGGAIDLGEQFTGWAYFEVGLWTPPVLQPMRVAIPNANLEGLSRKWNKVFLRVKDSIGCTLNGEEFLFDANLDEGPVLFTGFKDMLQQGWSKEDENVFSQSFPGPLTILGITGTVSVADMD